MAIIMVVMEQSGIENKSGLRIIKDILYNLAQLAPVCIGGVTVKVTHNALSPLKTGTVQKYECIPYNRISYIM